MCGRYSLTSPPEAMRRLFGFSTRPNLPARYNIAPTQDVPVVWAGGAEDVPELAMMRWGLVPSWAREIGRGAPLINARIETVLAKPAFRQAVRARRCLVPADGFYEWAGQAGGKQPYYVTLGARPLFAFAGIWERRRDAAGAVLDSMAILTAPSNRILAPLHDRMPVILGRQDYAMWLNCRGVVAADAVASIHLPKTEEFEIRAVSAYVNSVAHDDARCLEDAGLETRLL